MPKRWTAVLVLVASLFGFASVSAAGPGGVTARSPRILAAPRIAGLAITGQTLTAYRGTWSGRPTRYRFVWQRCSKSGATCRKAGRAHGARYRISGRDVGRRIRLVVTAWNRAGSKSARSKATPAVTKAGGPPTKSPPPVGGYFSLQPAGTWSRLPSGAECARLVHRSIWEPRPDNRKRNHIVPDANAVHRAFAARPLGSGGYDQRWDTWLLRRVDGQFTGTTDEIFQWGACKWGLSDDMVRAIADEESTWYQYLVYPSERCVSFYGCGDFFESSSAASKVFCDAIARYGHDYQRDYGSGLCPQTFSIVGIKSWQAPSWGRMPDNQNGTFPFARDSTAFGVDYIGSYLRGCYEGWIHWLREEGNYGSGDIWGCVGSWYSGDWHSSGAESYNNRVRSDLNRHTWLQRDWPSNRPPCSARYGCPRPDGL
jgi:hypothetical protein